MNFIEELEWRGLIATKSKGVEELFNDEQVTAYIGYDPTAPSLTIGNLVTVNMLRHLQLHGHRAIVLIGGVTAQVGDPSGKNNERELLDVLDISRNMANFRKQFRHLLDLSNDKGFMINNETIYIAMDTATFLRNIGKNITVNYMLAKESVQSRMKAPDGLSFTEFSYQLLQGYDFEYLYRKYDCKLQMGGSDQWGNMTTGFQFINKIGGQAYGITCPLLTKSDGTKFGKSESGNIWLDPSMTSPYKFYQFWLTIPDEDIERMFKIFSLKSRGNIEHLFEKFKENPKGLLEILADEMTIRIHGQEVFNNVKEVSKLMFDRSLNEQVLQTLTHEQFEMLAKELPVVQFKLGSTIEDIFVNGLVQSKSELRRAIENKAIAVNCKLVTSHLQVIEAKDLMLGQYILLQNGKKQKTIGIWQV